ncbi:MAG: dATP/dGTP pyrophosphohydrolase domain-containing protein [Geminicoccaceae bacterium]
MPTLDDLAIHHNDWARGVFTKSTPESVTEHLRREAIELAENPTDPSEMADVFLLLVWLADLTGTDLCGAIEDKIDINEHRKWGKPDSQGVVEHLDPACEEGV